MSYNLKDLFTPQDKPIEKSLPSPSSGKATGKNTGIKNEEFLSSGSTGTYTISAADWYTAKPYGFKATFRNGGTAVMFLPISPSNLTISTNFATNVVATLYGTVEEHSEVRYYDITIAGTTGMAPRFIAPEVSTEPTSPLDPGTVHNTLRRKGRDTFAVANSIGAGGFFAKTLSIANQIKQKAADLLDGGVKAQSGISPENSGYVAFHNLYRFLLQHKKDTSGTGGTTEKRSSHPLTFFNYKDNNQYDVVVRGFTMVRSAENPMLYQYTIQLRGYNLKSNTSSTVDEDLNRRLIDLGLNGVDGSTILGNIKSISSQAKGIIGSFVGGINVLGR